MPHADQSESSKQIRELLAPLPLKATANWILKAVKQAIKEKRIPPRDFMTTNDAVRHATTSGNRDWFAKSGVLTLHGRELLICEPFSEKVSLEMLKGLQSFVDTIDCTYIFSANSYCLPGRTIRIAIGPADLVNSYRLYEYGRWSARKSRRVPDENPN